MNIALLVTRADPVGGAQIHVRDLAVAARGHGHSPTVITSGSGPFLQDLQTQQIPVVVLKHLGAPISPVRDFRALREIRSALHSLRPDLLATHSSKAGILGRFVAHRLQIPAVFTATAGHSPLALPPLARDSIASSSGWRRLYRAKSSRSPSSIVAWHSRRESPLKTVWPPCITGYRTWGPTAGPVRAGTRRGWSWWPDSSRRKITLPCFMPLVGWWDSPGSSI